MPDKAFVRTDVTPAPDHSADVANSCRAAASNSRDSTGSAALLGVTGFGLIFTPAFYTLLQRA